MPRRWLFAIALSTPLIAFFVAYFLHRDSGLEPTGFIQYDNVSYIAYARQYLDSDHFHLFYSNPFNEGPNHQPIYFQPQTLFFALLLKMGLPPGIILPLFTILCTIISFWILIAIYDHIVPDRRNRTLNLWLLSWGGGLLVLAGVAYYYLVRPGGSVSDHLFTIDPESGWWGLSFGRSLFFSCEAYYHALFLAVIYFLIKRKWWFALITMLVLSLSHPFTGIELSLIVCAWAFFESLFFRKYLPVWFLAGALFVTAFHLWYYLVYLEQFTEHKSVSEQYSLTWGLRFYRMIPAYLIVGVLAMTSIYKASLRNFLQVTPNRIFLAWFVVAFALVNHDLFLSPKQPVHFTRGYVWTSLFLLGIPALQTMINRLKSHGMKWVVIGFTIIFLLDNFLWISLHINSRATGPSTAYITQEQKQVFKKLSEETSNQTLVISRAEDLAYLSTVYTSAYPLYSHMYTTPFAGDKKRIQERFLNQGIADPGLAGREICVILAKTDVTAQRSMQILSMQQIFESENYLIFRTKKL